MMNDGLGFLRRWTLAACCVLICSLFTFASPAWGAYDNVPTPTVVGPIEVTPTSHPFLATEIPLANYGYTEQEYFIEGTGYTYNTSGAVNVTGTKITTGGPNGDGTYPFRTRIVVRRPTDPAKFNGKVVVEWNNVTAGYDLEANWFGDPYYLLKNGYAWVGVSAQNVGVNYLKTKFNPSRYGSLEVGPAGDALSYDIFGSAIKAIRGDGSGPEPLGNLTPDITKVTASGESQSCGRLVTYFNKVAPIHQIIDNYLLTVCTTPIRADRPEKVLRVITEFENKAQQTEEEAPANPSLRHWEAAGGSHVPFLAAANWQGPVVRDTGPDIAYCAHSPVLSRVSWPYLVNVGTKDLDEWSEGGSAPPLAARGEYVNPTTLKRNSLGIALGGIRLPEMDVPTGVNLAENSPHPEPNPYPDSLFCLLLGQYQPFSEETLTGLYSDYGEYVDKVKADTDKLQLEGFLIQEDAQRLVESAEEFPRLRPTTPALGASSLAWRGPVPSHPESQVARFVETHPTFEVQHRPAAGGEWTTVASSLSEPKYSLGTEEGGTWIYRVRSRTVIPAYALEPEEVILSPWSEASGAITVLAGNVKGKLVVRSGQSVVLTSTANAAGAVTVESGGALDIEGATLSGSLKANGATLLRICGASVANAVKASNGSGPVVIGDGTAGCSASTFSATVKLEGNAGGVLVDGNVFEAGLTVTGNSGGTTVTNNTVAGSLTVTGNTGTVVDKPNKVAGKSKLQ
jgi:Alpha/beta hydrolase domain